MAAGPGGTLGDEIYPAEGIVYAGSFPGIDVLCDRDVMTGRPSQLPGRLLAPGAGRRVILHAMHSASDWLGYAVWQDGVLLRSLSLSPDGGITEDIGAPLPFEAPFWAGEHPVVGGGNFPAGRLTRCRSTPSSWATRRFSRWPDSRSRAARPTTSSTRGRSGSSATR